MTVKVNDSCIGCGACESICDAVFSVDGVAQVNEAAVADNIDAVKEAADACPVSAIEVEQFIKQHKKEPQKGSFFIRIFSNKKAPCWELFYYFELLNTC